MADFGCIRPFGIDNGELDNVTKQEAFVLGYELAGVDRLIELGVSFECPLLHLANKERIESKMVQQVFEGRQFWEARWSVSHNDQSESWVSLKATAMNYEDEPC